MLRNKDVSYNFLYNANYNRPENKEKFPSFPSSFNIIKELHNCQQYENVLEAESIEKSNDLTTAPLLLKSSKPPEYYTNYTTTNWNIQSSLNTAWPNRDDNVSCYHSRNDSGEDEGPETENTNEQKLELTDGNAINFLDLEVRNQEIEHSEHQRLQVNNTLQLTGHQFSLVSGLPTPNEYPFIRNLASTEDVPEISLAEAKQLLDCYANASCPISDDRDTGMNNFIENPFSSSHKTGLTFLNKQPNLLPSTENIPLVNKANKYHNNSLEFSIDNNELCSGSNISSSFPSRESNNHWTFNSALDIYSYPSEGNKNLLEAQKRRHTTEDNVLMHAKKVDSNSLTTPAMSNYTESNPHSIVRQLLEDPYLSDIIEKPQKRGLYRCAHCPSTFGTIFEYASHLDEYRVERKYKCPFKRCAWRILGLPRRSDLRRHCAIQHKYELYKELKRDLNLSEDAYPSLVCPVLFCQKEFYRRDAFKRHLSIVHQNENSRFNKRLKRISEECPLFETETEKIAFIKEKMACKKND
ncbi:Rme1p [Nakaseomyces bracarensis]|uniref:Rme1p n=1 Tax=Nakaseomyces bracarensis TaxID=273131 RepID=UPI003872715D